MDLVVLEHRDLGQWMNLERLEREPGKKTDTWNVMSSMHGGRLGQVRWFCRWRQYAFYPGDGTIFNPECLHLLQLFLHHLMDQRRKAKQKAKRQGAAT